MVTWSPQDLNDAALSHEIRDLLASCKADMLIALALIPTLMLIVMSFGLQELLSSNTCC